MFISKVICLICKIVLCEVFLCLFDNPDNQLSEEDAIHSRNLFKRLKKINFPPTKFNLENIYYGSKNLPAIWGFGVLLKYLVDDQQIFVLSNIGITMGREFLTSVFIFWKRLSFPFFCFFSDEPKFQQFHLFLHILNVFYTCSFF